MSELPTGWCRTTLGEVHTDQSKGIVPPSFPDEAFELYSVPSHAERNPEIVIGALIGSNKQVVVADTVLLCKINPRINRVWVVQPKTEFQTIASTEWIVFSPTPGIRPHYLAYYLRQNHIRDFLAQNASGVGGSLMRVKPSTLEGYPFLLAPLGEQDRIVAEIDKQFSRLDAAAAALKRAQMNLKRYRASVLKAACEGRFVPTEAELARKESREYEPADKLLEGILRERRARWEADTLAKMIASGKPPKDDGWKQKYEDPHKPVIMDSWKLPEGWGWVTLDQAAWRIRSGTAETSGRDATDYPVLKSSAIRPGRVDFNDVNYLKAEQSRRSANYIERGDFLITRLSGSLEYVGQSAYVEELPSYSIQYPDRVFCAKLVSGINGRFLAYCFRHQPLRTALEKAAKSTAGHQRISMTDLFAFTFPLPPIAEQARIAAALDRHLSFVDRLNAVVQNEHKRIDHTRQSILERAFSGKLVLQDPGDEPASVMLDRIRAERSASQSKSVPRPRNRDLANA